MTEYNNEGPSQYLQSLWFWEHNCDLLERLMAKRYGDNPKAADALACLRSGLIDTKAALEDLENLQIKAEYKERA